MGPPSVLTRSWLPGPAMSMAASANRLESSVANSLYSEASAVGAAPPLPDSKTNFRPMTRATSSSVASWASRCRTIGSSFRATPSRTVARTYSVKSSKRWLMGEKVNMVKRSRSNASEMY